MQTRRRFSFASPPRRYWAVSIRVLDESKPSSMANTNPGACTARAAELMMRASTDPGAPYYAVFITPGNGSPLMLTMTSHLVPVIISTPFGK